MMARRWFVRALLCGMLLAGSASTALASNEAGVVQLQLDAPAFAPEKIAVVVYLPPGYDRTTMHRYPVLYANDGQDMRLSACSRPWGSCTGTRRSSR